MTATLSLADVARLAGVARPVVSMWRKRPKDGLGFPAADENGRFSAADVVDYLEKTGRGNNTDARRDVALAAARSSVAETAIGDLLIAVAAGAVTGRSLADTDPEALLDHVEALDPDDEWLFRELEAVDIDLLADEADAVADAAWSAGDAFESLRATLRSRSQGLVEPGESVVSWMASLAQLLRSDHGSVVDVSGSAADIVLAMARHSDVSDALVVVPSDGDGRREARRRYAVHGVRTRIARFGDDWGLPDGSVLLAAVPTDPKVALDILDEVTMQLGRATTALVVGPASLLVDELPDEFEARRDRFLREPGRTLSAVVRLPQGLSRTGGREHLAVWLLQPNAPDVTRVGDLAGWPDTPTMWQQLLDDALAVAGGGRLRSFALLQPVPVATLLAAGRSLVDHDVAVTAELPASAGDDAARIRQLLDLLGTPLPDPFAAHTLVVNGSRPAPRTTLGAAARRQLVTVVQGVRMEMLPEGATPLWTVGAVTAGVPESVDLLVLSRAHPKAQLSRPGDVVFTTVGAPRAVVDVTGGAAVAYPARAVRVRPGAPLSPRAIAAAINDLPPGHATWRAWQVPLVNDPAGGDDALARVDELAAALRQRQAQVDELRRLVVRAVLPGAVEFSEQQLDDSKGA